MAFDREAFMRALNAPCIDRVKDIARASSAVVVYQGPLPRLRIAQGIAAAHTRPAVVVDLQSDDLVPGDGGRLLRPLRHGQTLVLVSPGTSDIPMYLATYWPRFCANRTHYSAQIAAGIILDRSVSIEEPGSVIVVQSEPVDLARTEVHVCTLKDEQAKELASRAEDWKDATVSLGRPPGTRLVFRDAEQAYRGYRQLVTTIVEAGHPRDVAEHIGKRAILGTDPDGLRVDFHYRKIDLQLHEILFGQLAGLSDFCRGITGGFSDDEPLDDVYAAALVISRLWKGTSPSSVVYRGQNRLWPVVPSFFRSRGGVEPNLSERRQRLERFVALLQRAHPELSESQCIAIAQHVSGEANAPTWLIDVTWDPLIAVYFASNGGEANTLGVVDQVVLPEWEQHVASQAELPGGVTLIEVPMLQRIQRQRGAFLNAPRADLYERYSPHRLWFRQRPGLVFNDATGDAPVSDDYLLPPELWLENLITALDDQSVRIASSPLTLVPPDPRTPLTAATLLATVANRDDVAGLDPFHRFVLEVAAELFANPQHWVADGNSTKVSLYRLDEVVRRVSSVQRQGRRCYVEEALSWTRSRVTDDEFSALIGHAHEIWMARYRVAPAHVAERVDQLVEDLRALAPTILGVTISGPADHVDVVLHTLAADDRWRYYDLRTSGVKDVIAVLPELVSGGVVLIATNPALDPYALRVLSESLSDRTGSMLVGSSELRFARDAMIVFVFGAGIGFHEIPARDCIAYSNNIDEFGAQTMI
jgi:hypothetical protein